MNKYVTYFSIDKYIYVFTKKDKETFLKLEGKIMLFEEFINPDNKYLEEIGTITSHFDLLVYDVFKGYNFKYVYVCISDKPLFLVDTLDIKYQLLPFCKTKDQKKILERLLTLSNDELFDETMADQQPDDWENMSKEGRWQAKLSMAVLVHRLKKNEFLSKEFKLMLI